MMMPAPGRQRDRADDRHRDGDQQRARRGDHEHGQEPRRVAAHDPGDQGDRARPPACRTCRAGRRAAADCGRCCSESRITCMIRAYRESTASRSARMVSAVSPLTAPESTGRSGRLGDPVRLAGEVGFVHHPVAVDHGPVDRADLVGEDHQRVADGHGRQSDTSVSRRLSCDGPPRACDAASARSTDEALRDRIRLQRLAAGEHQHDQGPGQILAEQHRRDDRDPAKQVGAELALGRASRSVRGEDGRRRPGRRSAGAGRRGSRRPRRPSARRDARGDEARPPRGPIPR